MKKSIILILSFILIFSIPLNAADTQENTLKIGDYVFFGEYESIPLLWQVIHLDAQKNPLLFSVASIRSMAFDAAESGTYGIGDTTRDAFGSNLWKASNIKEWLNSDLEQVVFSSTSPTTEAVSLHYNYNEEIEDISYSEAHGFLREFSQNEKSMILNTRLTTAVPSVDASVEAQDPSVFTFSSSLPEEVIIGYGSKRKTTDTSKVFLLNINEYYEYVSKRGLLGPRDNGFWLRTPEGSSDYLVSIVDQSGGIMKTSAAFSSVGVMPALYLNKELVKFNSGVGNIDLPYQLVNYQGDGKLINEDEKDFFEKLINEIQATHATAQRSSVTLEALTKKIEKAISTYYQLNIPNNSTIESLLTSSYIEKMENSRAFIYDALINNKITLNRRIELEPYINMGNSDELDITLTKDILETTRRYKCLHIFSGELGLRLDSLNIKKELYEKKSLRILISRDHHQIKVSFYDDSGLKLKQLQEQIGIYVANEKVAHMVISSDKMYLAPIYYNLGKAFFNTSTSNEFTMEKQLSSFNDTGALSELDIVSLNNLVGKGIINGYLDGSFKPNNNITRGEVSKILSYTLYSKPYEDVYKYVDVYGNEWYAPSVLLLSQEGIIKGYPDGMFRANQSISLQEVYTLLSRALKNERNYMSNYINNNRVLPEYKLSNWAIDDVALMQQEEIVYEGLTKDLSKSATRIEVVRLIDLLIKSLY